LEALRLSEIWIYPIKSLGGISVSSATVRPKGLQFDRRMMLADEDGKALTQREFPRMALFKTSFSENAIEVKFGNDSISVPLSPVSVENEISAEVWGQQIKAVEIQKSFSEWFSKRLELQCRLLYFPEENPRPVDASYRINDEDVSLADAYPILIIGQESLNDLNHRLGQPVPMNRFRPNLVFSGGDAFSEDEWDRFSIGKSEFAAVKPCARCVLTTVDQETAVRGAEPLKSLAKYRTRNNKVYFGQNVLVILAEGMIRVGDTLTIQTKRQNESAVQSL
jgi:uncharacterized protein